MTLTVTADTPDELYPYCDFHSGMYSQGKIVKVSSYNQNNIDITSSSGALKVKGTVASGPFKGASGYTYKVYLKNKMQQITSIHFMNILISHSICQMIRDTMVLKIHQMMKYLNQNHTIRY